MGAEEATAGRTAVCSLRSVSFIFLRPASIYCTGVSCNEFFVIEQEASNATRNWDAKRKRRVQTGVGG